MGKIYKISCKCGYVKELYIGGGLASCNINMVNRVFLEEKRKELIDIMYKARKSFFESLPNANIYLKGWMNRLNDMYGKAMNNLAVTAGGLGVFLIAAGIYYYYKNKMS